MIIGNCTMDDVIEHLFGDVSHFACLVEEYGDTFTIGDIYVTYDIDLDVHTFHTRDTQ